MSDCLWKYISDIPTLLYRYLFVSLRDAGDGQPLCLFGIDNSNAVHEFNQTPWNKSYFKSRHLISFQLRGEEYVKGDFVKCLFDDVFVYMIDDLTHSKIDCQAITSFNFVPILNVVARRFVGVHHCLGETGQIPPADAKGFIEIDTVVFAASLISKKIEAQCQYRLNDQKMFVPAQSEATQLTFKEVEQGNNFLVLIFQFQHRV